MTGDTPIFAFYEALKFLTIGGCPPGFCLEASGEADLSEEHYAALSDWVWCCIFDSCSYGSLIATMKDHYELTWQAEDGYAGGARPQYTVISLDDLEDYETEQEVRDAIEEIVREDFNQKVCPSWDTSQEDTIIEMLKKRKQPQQKRILELGLNSSIQLRRLSSEE